MEQEISFPKLPKHLKIFQYIAFGSLSIAVLYPLLLSLLYHLSFEELLSSSAVLGMFGFSILGIVFLSIVSFLRPVPAFEKTFFWIKRALFDSVLGIIILPIVSIVVFWIVFFIILLAMGSDLSVFQNDPTQAVNILPAGLLLFLAASATQFGLIGLMLIRKRTKAFPEGTLKISFEHIGRNIGIVILSYLSILVFTIIFGLILQHFGLTMEEDPLFKNGVKDNFLLIFLIAAVSAPIVEEIFFRGYLLTIMSGKSQWIGLIVSSLLFASAHFREEFVQQPYFLSIYAILGLVLGVSYLKTKNILVPILIHMLNNSIALLLLQT